MSEENKNKSSIAMKLRMLRVENNLSQTDVARELGITQQTYSKYENLEKDVSIDSAVIKKLCALYGISADYLLGLEQEEHVEPKPTTLSFNGDVEQLVKQLLSQLGKGDKENK